MRVNEIFYTLQGEGCHTGLPAVFVRMAGCNLKCPFCDTDHEGFSVMTEAEIIESVSKYDAPTVVITGGEPTMQLTLSLVNGLREVGKRVHIETNGSIDVDDELVAALDWITVSPKSAPIRISRIDELKVLDMGQDLSEYDSVNAKVKSLQPLDEGDAERNARNVASTVSRVMENPSWRLSLQTHKTLNIP